MISIKKMLQIFIKLNFFKIQEFFEQNIFISYRNFINLKIHIEKLNHIIQKILMYLDLKF